MEVIHGNLITVAENGGYDIVLHNCNCFNTMGSGVAYDIARAWPEVAAVDALTTRGDMSKLGTFTYADVVRNGNAFRVFNIYGQYRYGSKREQHFDIAAFTNALLDLKLFLGDKKYSIVFPLLGTGSGGGRWRLVSHALNEILCEHSLTLVKL